MCIYTVRIKYTCTCTMYIPNYIIHYVKYTMSCEYYILTCTTHTYTHTHTHIQCVQKFVYMYVCTWLYLLHRLTTDYTSLTQFGVSGLAPLSSNSLTVSTWPALTAHVRGVSPSCVHNVSIVQCTHMYMCVRNKL